MKNKNNSKNPDWFEKFKKTEEYEMFAKNPVAYFSAEYGLESSLPTYAGGLGILAGDFVREVGMQDFPLVSVGLMYKKAQGILSLKETEKNSQLKVVLGEDGEEVVVELPLENRTVKIRALQWQEGNAKVYLLDTDMEANDEMDRNITKNLYDEDRDMRLKQEIVLGIGGFRFLARLGHHPSVYHLNEGHSAFLALELVRHEMDHQKVDFHAACQFAKRHVIFTNHTLVLAGQERFSKEKVEQLIDPCAKEICINSADIAELGAEEGIPNSFSMTKLSFNLSSKSNAVSKIHLEKADLLWPNQMTDYITNGIFIDRWDKIKEFPSQDIWTTHLNNKRILLNLIKEQIGQAWEETDLIFVWARRLVEYKQPLLFLDNLERLTEIIANSKVKIRIIFSGPTSEIENKYITAIKEIIEKKLISNVIFVPNYSIHLAEILTAGADIWLNTPVVGREACGTSGMKAGLNGVLALSTRDGWIAEVDEEEIGWIADEKVPGAEIFHILEKKIIPLYNKHLNNVVDSEWTERMNRARNLVLEQFSTTRTLKEYVEKLYIPVLQQKHTRKTE